MHVVRYTRVILRSGHLACGCSRVDAQSLTHVNQRFTHAHLHAACGYSGVLCCARAALSRGGIRWFVVAAFALGPNSNGCPPAFLRLDYDKACERAAVIANQIYGGSLSPEQKGLMAAYPAGCYWHTVDGRIYFNAKVSSGTVNSFALQMCAGALIPALRYPTHATKRGVRLGTSRAAFSTCVCEVWHACQ